ncbi:hypothetical protein [Streptomyces sp. NPDC001530]
MPALLAIELGDFGPAGRLADVTVADVAEPSR